MMAGLFDLSGKCRADHRQQQGHRPRHCRAHGEHGAKVVVSSRKAAACEAVAADINGKAWANGGEATVIPANIGHKDQLQALVDQTVAKWGGIDILVCNAAVSPYFGPSIDCPDDAFDRVMGSNVRSNFWLCNMVLPQMATRGGGAIVIISSIAGPARHADAGRLRDFQGGGHRAGAQPGGGVGGRRTSAPTASRRAWCGRISPARCGRPGDPAQAGPRQPVAAHRRAGRDRGRGGVPGEPGGQLHHGAGLRDRRGGVTIGGPRWNERRGAGAGAGAGQPPLRRGAAGSLSDRRDGWVRRADDGAAVPGRAVQPNLPYRHAGGAYVLRKKPPACCCPRPTRWTGNTRSSPPWPGARVPVAPMRLLCRDESVIGTMFYVMDHVPGRVFADRTLRGVAPADRAAMYDDMNRGDGGAAPGRLARRRAGGVWPAASLCQQADRPLEPAIRGLRRGRRARDGTG